MNHFIITEEFWELFPQAQLGVIVARGITNGDALPEDVREAIRIGLVEAQAKVPAILTAPVFSENPSVQVWREAFKKFKTKKGARSSIEALLKRAQKGTGIPSINPLVDLYNTVSLTWGLPCGGEDIDQFQGDLQLTVAAGGETFKALGDETDDPALPGEVIYRDEAGAVCRCFNWRDGQRTMLTPETRNAFLVMESVDPARTEDLRKAIAELAQAIESQLGGEVSLHFLNREQPQIRL